MRIVQEISVNTTNFDAVVAVFPVERNFQKELKRVPKINANCCFLLCLTESCDFALETLEESFPAVARGFHGCALYSPSSISHKEGSQSYRLCF